MELRSNGQFILKLGSLLLAFGLWLLGFCECSLLNVYEAKAKLLLLILSVA
jgi:hypothetical protein